MEQVKPYKSLIMEIRPRIQSVNVYITLIKSSTVTVNLNLDNFEIVQESLRYKIQCEGFHIVPDSLSCFSCKDNYVMFRFSTENVQKQLGTSRCEIVEVNKQTCSNYSLSTFIKLKVSYCITCFNCTQAFCKDVEFERVLPFPENSDSSEWFCHAHGNSNETQSLVPKLNEIFYSHCFVHLNRDLLTGFVQQNLNLVCKRCLAWIGTKLKTDSYKIWLNTVNFNDSNNNFKSNPLDDVFKTVRQSLSNSLLSSIRIILNCENDFILLWILEKKLRVNFDCNPTFKIDDDVCKVLFKFNKNQSDLVNQWMGDVNVSMVDISKSMMVKLLEHLYDMNQYIPRNFSISNDFHISYLVLYKEDYNK